MVNFLHPSLPLPIHLPCRKGMSTTVEAAPQPKKSRQSHLSDPHNGTGTHNLLPHDDNTTFDAESNTDLPQISSETRWLIFLTAAQTNRRRHWQICHVEPTLQTVMYGTVHLGHLWIKLVENMIRFIPILTNFPTFLYYVQLRSTYYDTHDPRNKTYHPIFGMQPTVWLEPTSEPTSTVTVAILHVQESKTFAPKSIRIGRFRSRTYFWRIGW